MRILKLAKSWKELQQLIRTLWQTLIDISSFTLVLFLVMFIYTIVGMELFANEVKFTNDTVDLVNGSSLSYNFDSFLQAFTTIFIGLT
jgi:hypothetical protein